MSSRLPICLRSARAEADLLDIWLSIAADNPRAADKQLDRIDAMFILLANNPELGPARPELAPDLRHFAVGNYLILYRRITDGVQVVRVVHRARFIPHLI